ARRAARAVRRPRDEEVGRRMTTPAAARVDEKTNPLAEALERQPVHATALVIFGATGDLARRKLLPALYNIAHEGALPEHFALVEAVRSVSGERRFCRIAPSRRREPVPPVGALRYATGVSEPLGTRT